ncbi:MAG: hypothetical protein RLZZ203_234 [Cyanobacteriota bacterium]|jgi:hypothetical protein
MKSHEELLEFCQTYNIPSEYLVPILSDPKVVPMIRGKAFEFSVVSLLSKALNPEEWIVDKPIINSQLGIHDTDVRVTHLKTNKVISVECKLAKNLSYKRLPVSQITGSYINRISVKCMRSRTLGKEMVDRLAPKLGISEKVLGIHNDQYLPSNFDFVVTSIGNAFYQTNPQTKEFEWNPTILGMQFLQSINDCQMELKDFAFYRMYIARSRDIIISEKTGIKCTRRKCNNPTNCGFIPNYPALHFEDGNQIPLEPWIPLERSEDLFNQIII